VGRPGAGDLEPPPGHRPLLLWACRRRRWLVDDLTIDLERRPEPATAPRPFPWLSWSGCGAATLFRQASDGWTLHQLRHSALTHLAEQNVSLPLLMAKSRHASLRSLQRYARPGPEAVAALTAAADRARRRS
jgi:integrase